MQMFQKNFFIQNAFHVNAKIVLMQEIKWQCVNL